MAKEPVTEDEVRAGIRSLGGFSALSQTPGPRRDSPFRDSTAPDNLAVSAPIQNGRDTLPRSGESLISMQLADEAVTRLRPPKPIVSPAPSPMLSKPVTQNEEKRQSAVHATPDLPRALQEFITVPMSIEMRDELNLLAKKLQRRKRSTRRDSTGFKPERITANTIIRAACSLVLDQLSLEEDDCPRSEQELFELFRRRLTGKRP